LVVAHKKELINTRGYFARRSQKAADTYAKDVRSHLVDKMSIVSSLVLDGEVRHRNDLVETNTYNRAQILEQARIRQEDKNRYLSQIEKLNLTYRVLGMISV
jgi:hypothetical protein